MTGVPVKMSQTHCERTIWHNKIKQHIYLLISLCISTDNYFGSIQDVPKTECHESQNVLTIQNVQN